MKSKQAGDGRGSVVAILPADGRSGFDGNSDSQAGWSSVSISKWDQPTEIDRRSDKIRSWRRRALLKRGARLHMAMAANAQQSSLAMLDEAGIVVCWYGSPGGRDYASEEVVDRHLSLFYVSEEVTRRQPYRDLRTAVIEGRITRQAWRRGSDGSAFWGTIDIEPVVLRDGRVQGFSYVASVALENGAAPTKVVYDTEHILRARSPPCSADAHAGSRRSSSKPSPGRLAGGGSGASEQETQAGAAAAGRSSV